MTDNIRPVDQAMLRIRPEKQKMRSLWADKFKAIKDQYPQSDVPLYLTLSGAEGLDIQFFIEQGLIEITEVGSIAEIDQNKIVAVERNKRAVIKLQSKFIGLEIIEADFNSIISGSGPLAFPTGKNETKCRARIINLDLDSSLDAQKVDDAIIFPVLEWIKKICTIHSAKDHCDWILCLTLDARLNWNEQISSYIRDFIVNNINHDATFASSCLKIMGEDLYSLIHSSGKINFSILTRNQQQIINMIFVPKLIAKLIAGDNWKVFTESNLFYGSDGYAPMVSWIMHFTWESQPVPPDHLYRSSLHEIFSHIGTIREDGQLMNFS
jgi:hypothetical protein